MAADKFDPSTTGALYNRHAARWQLELDASEWTLDVLASGTYLDGFSSKEHPDDYAYRKRMACPLDMCRDGVRIRVDNLWRTAPKREIQKGGTYAPIIEQLIADADAEGTPLDTFMKGACWDHYVTGCDIVTQVTRPADGVEIVTKADEAAIRPYFMWFSPLERFDWSVNGSRNFNWARYCLGVEPSVDERGLSEIVTRYLTLTGEGWRIWRVEEREGVKVTTMEAEGTHTLGRPPIDKLYFAESHKAEQGAVPLSLLTRPAVVSRVMMNLKSQADADLLAAVTRYFMSGIDAGELPDTYGPGTIWKMSDPNAKISVAQGDVNHIREKREWVNLYIGEILRLLKFRGGMAEITANSGSGLKLAMERTDLENELRATAGQLEKTELEMMRKAVCLVKGVDIKPENAAEELGFNVQYNKDFTLEPVGEMLDNLKKWVEAGFVADEVPAIGREILGQLANTLMREGTQAHTDAVEEITAASFEGVGGAMDVPEVTDVTEGE